MRSVLHIHFVIFLWQTYFPLIAQTYHPVDVVNSNALPGENICRSMHLLESSTIVHPNEVRIMIYGQSITRMEWWLIVREYLLQKYPKAKLNIQNFAISGFQAERLVRCVERDILDFYPDLIIFHDYGGEETYEEIIRMFRTLTTAEIMVMNDHIGLTQNQEWHDRHSWEWLPGICKKYGLELVDVRTTWIRYAKKYGHEYQAFLSDNVHMNPFGNYLMAEIVKAHLVYDPIYEKDADSLISRTSYTQVPTEDADNQWIKRKFKGNRMDLIYSGSFDNIKENIWIDDILVGEYLGKYIPSRVYIDKNGPYPQKMGIPVKIDLQGKLISDHCQMVIKEVENDGYKIHFDMYCDHSGFQGSGNSLSSFSSENGIVFLQPENWFYRKEPGYFSAWKSIEAGDIIHFEIKHLNEIIKDPATGKSRWIIKGLSKGDHEFRIEMNHDKIQKAELIQVIYNPPLYNTDQ